MCMLSRAITFGNLMKNEGKCEKIRFFCLSDILVLNKPYSLVIILQLPIVGNHLNINNRNLTMCLQNTTDFS